MKISPVSIRACSVIKALRKKINISKESPFSNDCIPKIKLNATLVGEPEYAI